MSAIFFCERGTSINNNKEKDLEINEEIRDPEVRLIGADGEQLGVMATSEALKLAEEAGVDLVKIVSNATPPVAKIIDYGKYKYSMLRKEKEAKKKQKVVELKEIRLTPNIDTNDLNTKIAAARKFLEKGNKVKVTLRFRGREMTRMQDSGYILDNIAEQLADISTVDKDKNVEGRNMMIVLSSKK